LSKPSNFFKESGDREARTPCLLFRAFWRHRHRSSYQWGCGLLPLSMHSCIIPLTNLIAHKLNGEISARAWENCSLSYKYLYLESLHGAAANTTS